MSKRCQIKDKKALKGNLVSHSNIKTTHFQQPNLQWKRFWVPEYQKWIRLRVGTDVIKTITKKGLVHTLKKYGKLKEILG